MDSDSLERAVELDAQEMENSSQTLPPRTLAERMRQFERTCVLLALQENRFDMAATAKVLGLLRANLYRKCHRLRIDLKQECATHKTERLLHVTSRR
jgi:DNA-binding NtrC family response regulator